MFDAILQGFVYLAVPLAALIAADRYQLFEFLNPVVVTYAVGMAMANTPVADVDVATAKFFTQASVPLAVPLILFPSDFRAWLRQSRETVVSFCCAVVAVCVASLVAAWIFHGMVDEFWKISGMLIGVYTGGTPNLNSIGMALGAQENTFGSVIAADVVASAFYFLFLMTVAQTVLGYVLPPFSLADDAAEMEDDEGEPTGFAYVKHAAPQAASAFGLSVALVGASVGLTYLTVGEMSVAGVFLGLTTGGIVGSFIPAVRELEGSYELGDYLILVFCVSMGARTNFAELVGAGWSVLLYTSFVVYGSILLHLLLAAVFRVDVDTFLITSTAALFGPAFVPAIAEALDNRRVVISGLTAGLVGYAVANYLGIGMAYLMQPG